MANFLLRRLAHGLTILLGVSALVFTCIMLAPGDAIDSMLPPESFASAAARAQMRHQLGLDQPAPIVYLRWLGRVARGDLGYSLISQKPITHVIGQRLPASLELVGFALILSLIVGIATGVVAAIKQYSWLDYIVTFSSLFWVSIPGFFLGLLMIYIFAVRLDWFPAFGATTADARYPLLDRAHHVILPGGTLGFSLAATISRYTRASLLEVLHADYLRTARAKGLKEWHVIAWHALKNALIPIITVVAFQMPILIGGAVIIETVFQWPGLGLLTLNAATQKDYPLILALALIVTLVVVVSSFIADLAYGLIDPRIRLQ